jgi:hypothetical protein
MLNSIVCVDVIKLVFFLLHFYLFLGMKYRHKHGTDMSTLVIFYKMEWLNVTRCVWVMSEWILTHFEHQTHFQFEMWMLHRFIIKHVIYIVLRCEVKTNMWRFHASIPLLCENVLYFHFLKCVHLTC